MKLVTKMVRKASRTGLVRGDELVFDAANGQHQAAQRQLARHGRVAAHGAPREQADECCCQRDARARTVLLHRAGRQMDCSTEARQE